MSRSHFLRVLQFCFIAVLQACTLQACTLMTAEESDSAPALKPALKEETTSRVFLQQVSHNSAIVKWRGTPAAVWFGSKPGQLTNRITAADEGHHKIATLTNLQPDTLYHYAFTNDASISKIRTFRTAPATGESPHDGSVHIWLIGDSGTATEHLGGHYEHAGEAAAVRDGFLKYNREQADDEPVDLLLLLGDNAYLEGTDEQWQGAFFDIYPDIIGGAATWPTIGNHEMGTGAPFNICLFRKIPGCDAGPVMMNLGGTSEASDVNTYDSDGDGPDASGFPYLNIFTLPSKGEMGGVASGTEQYYSFNYGNVHIVSLDSQLSNRDKIKRQTMRAWLIDDLSANTAAWTIVIFHHPPYSKGENHDSDREQNEVDMRQTFAPVFEDYGVDVVYSGHSHSYERSWYLRGHHGMSDTFNADTHAFMNADGMPSLGQGDDTYSQTDPVNGDDDRAVYTVAGNAGKADKLNPCPDGQFMGCTLTNWLMHPAHRTFNESGPGYMQHGIARKGSVVLDAKENELTSRFVDEHGEVLDEFTIVRH